MRPVRPLLEFVGRGYDNTGAYFSRLNTILGNPNIYAGLMSVACLMSLWLVLTSREPQTAYPVHGSADGECSFLPAGVLDGLARRICRSMRAHARAFAQGDPLRSVPAGAPDRGHRANRRRGIGQGLR